MWRDDAYLLDILLYARKAVAMTQGVSWQDFAEDDVLQLATQHALQIIGEAAGKLSKDCRLAHPEIPWDKIIGLRHRIVHDYPRIELPKIWAIIQSQLPRLIEDIAPLVKPEHE